ncbi:MAG: hypothetical protein Kow0026_17000 [Oricola sp.]
MDWRSLVVAAVIGLSATTALADDQPTSSGTGFFVNAGGWLVTNRHVTDGCARVEVQGYGEGQNLIEHPSDDLALLRVKTANPVMPVELRAAPPKLGEEIVALGYPLSGLLSDTIKITTGNISSLAGIGNDPRYLQFSAPIQPGNSGGPLIDRSGSVVGVISATVRKEVSDAIDFNVQNVNFSIRIDAVRRFLTDQGIAFNTSGKDAPELSTADIAEKLEPSTVQVLCYGEGQSSGSSPNAANGSLPSPGSATGFAGEMRDAFGYDAIGFDYTTVRNVSYDQCKQACVSQSACHAITYNTRYNVCFLKTNALVLVRNGDAAAAYEPYLATELLITDFTVYANTDAPGGDYSRIRDADFVGCTVKCMTDSRCRAFSYVRRTGDCWLKDRIGGIRELRGVEFGIK